MEKKPDLPCFFWRLRIFLDDFFIAFFYSPCFETAFFFKKASGYFLVCELISPIELRQMHATSIVGRRFFWAFCCAPWKSFELCTRRDNR
jgi:hypothetical protein